MRRDLSGRYGKTGVPSGDRFQEVINAGIGGKVACLNPPLEGSSNAETVGLFGTPLSAVPHACARTRVG